MTQPTNLTASPEAAAAFSACIHCGLCLPACPTYVETGMEPESPRGRLHLMQALVEGRVQADRHALQHLDSCLVCRACETACPSGVNYHAALEMVRPQASMLVRGRGQENRVLDWLVRRVLPHRKRVRRAMLPLRLLRACGLGPAAVAAARRLSVPLGAMAAAMPRTARPAAPRRAAVPAAAMASRGRVLLLTGCIGGVVSGEINAAARAVLERNGYAVQTLRDEPCCGALAAHANYPAQAREFARQVVDLLDTSDAAWVVSPIAGCGAQLKQLHHVLANDRAYTKQAQKASARVRDITELLAAQPLVPPQRPMNVRAVYHDPCHLLHAQKIADAPRQLLAQVPGLTLVPLPEADICCGAAGTYNLSQPAMAEALGARKASAIRATGATLCITANVGCQLQLQNQLRSGSPAIPVRHVVEVLAEAYGQ